MRSATINSNPPIKGELRNIIKNEINSLQKEVKLQELMDFFTRLTPQEPQMGFEPIFATYEVAVLSNYTIEAGVDMRRL